MSLWPPCGALLSVQHGKSLSMNVGAAARTGQGGGTGTTKQPCYAVCLVLSATFSNAPHVCERTWCVDGAVVLDDHLVEGECAGLVGAEHVHAGHLLNGGKAGHNGTLGRQLWGETQVLGETQVSRKRIRAAMAAAGRVSMLQTACQGCGKRDGSTPPHISPTGWPSCYMMLQCKCCGQEPSLTEAAHPQHVRTSCTPAVSSPGGSRWPEWLCTQSQWR